MEASVEKNLCATPSPHRVVSKSDSLYIPGHFLPKRHFQSNSQITDFQMA